MEGAIKVEAGGMDKKYFYAFFKGLVNIKYKDQFSKSKDIEVDDTLDLQFLYSNLFNSQETSLEQFNKLVEGTLNIIETIVQNNMSKDDLEEFLTNQVKARDDHKRQIAQYWKNEQNKIIKALNEPLRNQTGGISEIDWEIHVTTASRHQGNINQQSATVVIQPKRGNVRDKIMFEMGKKDAKQILDKLSSLDALLNSAAQLQQ
ncbi:UNKNOWN [Stylonychia lemnae]|uniref:COMMD1 N-terminal domain-containing protein n=1 Tax=Stylonychia lemnae TaxID=5949 RepID=A0A078ATM6_STYLE|nr:UNKNOWN [Stylonychia lemnae]|eukprot:CDW85594.1 UNKNOWN [Stylonychia lemnae]